MTYQEIVQQLRAKEFAPVYFLHGQEPYYIDKITTTVEQSVLTESEKAFNQEVLYGKDIGFKNVLDICQQYPMMAERRVVVIKEAQYMRDLEKLLPYVQKPTPTTILVIAHKHKKLDGRTSFAKTLKSSSAIVFESKPLYDNQVEGWIAKLLASRKIKYESGVTALLAEHLGNDLEKIEKEVDKLKTNLPEDGVVTHALVEQYIGISRQYNVFELQKAMSNGDLGKAMTIVDYFSKNEKEAPPVLIVGSLYNYFNRLLTVGMNRTAPDKVLQRKLNLSSAYFLREYRQAIRFWNGRKVLSALELLSEYDLRIKGVVNRSTPPMELVREMVLRMMTY
ncbi:MAG: DNA polymerase III subunit delta [Saprospiraceae bacterium]|nr:DNA polymerase III subunit delta [Saprospiraceae bacterium]